MPCPVFNVEVNLACIVALTDSCYIEDYHLSNADTYFRFQNLQIVLYDTAKQDL